MMEIRSQRLRTGDGWTGVPSRAAGLYGELQPLPLPIAAPVPSALARKPRAKAGPTD